MTDRDGHSLGGNQSVRLHPAKCTEGLHCADGWQFGGQCRDAGFKFNFAKILHFLKLDNLIQNLPFLKFLV